MIKLLSMYFVIRIKNPVHAVDNITYEYHYVVNACISLPVNFIILVQFLFVFDLMFHYFVFIFCIKDFEKNVFDLYFMIESLEKKACFVKDCCTTGTKFCFDPKLKTYTRSREREREREREH